MTRSHVIWIALMGVGLAAAPTAFAQNASPVARPPESVAPQAQDLANSPESDAPQAQDLAHSPESDAPQARDLAHSPESDAPQARDLAPTPGSLEADDGGPDVFIPPDRDAPRLRVGSATRGGADTVVLNALAPDQVGLTLAEQPAIYWYVSTPSEHSVNFTLRRAAGAKPLAEFALEPPQSAGLQAVRLADHAVRLKPEIDYQWFVSFGGDDAEAVAGGGIAFVATSPELAAMLAEADASERARVLARAGIWYDAVDVLVQRISDAPENAARRLRLATLLEQVGLVAVAAAERDRAVGHSVAADADAIALPIYSPPRPVRASYPRHLAGLGARGTEAGATGVRLFALAPNHLGVSVRAQPTLYWFLEADTGLAVAFTLIGEGAAEPLLDLTLPAPFDAGYHAVHLGDHGVSLEPGIRYEWTAALVNGERQVHPTISVGFIEYREAEPDLARELTAAGERDAVHTYARRGLWYDAFDDLSHRIESDPHDPVPQLQRAALLHQVGLTPVAAHERARAAAQP